MLRPTKHSDPTLTVLPVAAFLLRRLRKHRVESVSGLAARLRKDMPSTNALFAPAIGLLFALALVEYRSHIDSFEYVGP